jgi:hypothetical protein
VVEDIVHVSDEEMSKKVITNFHKYYRKGEIIEEEADNTVVTQVPGNIKLNVNFSCWSNLISKNGKRGQDLFYSFLSKVYDTNEQELYNYLPLYIKDLVKSGVLTS